MQQVTENTEFTTAGMYAWNTLTTLLSPDDRAVFDNTEEFREFYNQIIERIFEEEAKA